jgi:hypothetical protein
MDDFKYFYDTNYLELITRSDGDILIYNNKYKFLFNHESPGHGDLYITQNWEKGINHYIVNDYEEFKNRYNRRIQNFKNLLNSSKVITFILTRPNTHEMCDINDLNNALLCKYPFLHFNFVFRDCCKYYYYEHLLIMKVDENEDEIKRLCI